MRYEMRKLLLTEDAYTPSLDCPFCEKGTFPQQELEWMG
jgi:hypothetical protein